jgi:hypothetical protein
MASGNPAAMADATLEFSRYLAEVAEPRIRGLKGDWGIEDQGNLTDDIISLQAQNVTQETAQGLTRQMESNRGAFQYMRDLFDVAFSRVVEPSELPLVQYGGLVVQNVGTAMAAKAGGTPLSPMQMTALRFSDTDDDPTSFPDFFQAHLRGFMGLEPGAPYPLRPEDRTNSSAGA